MILLSKDAMYEAITNYVIGSKYSCEEWRKWQATRALAHYTSSDTFKYYVTQKPNTISSISNVDGYSAISINAITIYQAYYDYCFGDFSVLLISPQGGESGVIKYATMLLELYDVCKGYSRKLFGDSLFISALREFTVTKDCNTLAKFPYVDYNYDYSEIHAHTVAVFSLTSLIALLMKNYIGHYDPQYKLETISHSLCAKAYNESVFGFIKPSLKMQQASAVINIPKLNQEFKLEKCKTWPQISSIKCKRCFRLTEGSWGKFNVCIDCYVKRVCASCGAEAHEIGNNKLPICSFHKKLEDSS